MKPPWLTYMLVMSGLLLEPAVSRAQVTTGTILGREVDHTGAAVPDATVSIKETAKGTSQQYKTDANGSYYVPFLIPGTYSVTIEKRGFKAALHDNIILKVDQKQVVDFSLDLAEVSQTVTVTAAVPLVKSESAELGEVITGPAVRSLPLNSRNFAQLVYLVPGVTTGQQGENLSGASTFNPRAASDYNALGSQANTNAWLVDGIWDNEYTFNTVLVQPSVESVQEFKVLTGTYSAQFGGGAGVVSVSTRSGSNELHGEAFEFLCNRVLDAKPYQFTPTPVVKPPFKRNQFGVVHRRPGHQHEHRHARPPVLPEGGLPNPNAARKRGPGHDATESIHTFIFCCPRFPHTQYGMALMAAGAPSVGRTGR